MGLKWLLFWGSCNHPYLWWLTRRTPRTWRQLYSSVWFIIAKGLSQGEKSTSDRVWRNPDTGSKVLSLGAWVVTKNIGLPPAVNYSNACAVFVFREACLRVTVPMVFIGGQSCKQFRPPEEKHMFIINHLLCTNNLGKLVQQGLLSQAFKIATSVSNVRKILKTKDHSSNQALLKSNIRPALSRIEECLWSVSDPCAGNNCVGSGIILSGFKSWLQPPLAVWH